MLVVFRAVGGFTWWLLRLGVYPLQQEVSDKRYMLRNVLTGGAQVLAVVVRLFFWGYVQAVYYELLYGLGWY